MEYNFDQVHNRTGTNAIKYNYRLLNKPDGIIPLWVADMEFQAPAEVIDALHQEVTHGIFGYNTPGAEYFDALQQWFSKRFDWEVQREWLVSCPGVVYALNTAVKAFTKPKESVLIFQPVYAPFAGVVNDNDRNLVISELVRQDGQYRIDFEDLEQKITANEVKMLILCSPHNPVGRVWTRQELAQIAGLCVKHHVLIVSDEIHADFVYTPHQHTVCAGISPEISELTITCTAPSKTFNLAGLQASNVFIANPELRRSFQEALKASGFHGLNNMGIVGCQTAYQYGEAWLEQLLIYLQGNISFANEFLKEHLPQVRITPIQGTYLLWLDFRELGLSAEALDTFLTEKAGLWLNAGPMFGQGGEGFQRMNIACPRATLMQAMEQLKDAVMNLKG